jgi:hypothetical protein
VIKAPASGLLVATLLVLEAAVIWFLYMPMQMDMASHYHPLACLHFPLSYFNTLIEPCNRSYVLDVHGWFDLRRASTYQGFFPSFWYYPLYLVWNDYHSLFLINSIYLILGVIALSWFARIDFWIAFIVFGGNAFVQYLILYDYALLGTVPFIMFMVPALIAYAVETKTTGRGIAAGILAGILVFAVFETKPVFVYLFPCTALLLIMRWRQERWELNRFYRILPGALLAALLAGILLTSLTSSGQPYWRVLLGYTKYNADPSPYFQRFWHIIDAYWLRFPNSAAPTYSESSDMALLKWRGTKELLVTIPFWLCALCFVYLGRRGSRILLFTAASLLAAGILHSLQLANVYNAYHANHMAPGIFYAVAAVAVAAHAAFQVRRKATSFVLAMLMLSQIACAIYMVNVPAAHRASPEIAPLITYLDRSGINSRYLTLHYDWGTYYLDAVYGPRDQVVMFSPYSFKEAGWKNIKRKAEILGRPIAIVRRADSNRGIKQIRQQFPTIMRIYPLEGESGVWEIWLSE